MVLSDAPAGNSAGGFTIVEVVVTLAVLGLLIASFFQSYMLVESQRVSVARQATANDVAYSNLRKFATIASASVACNASGTSLVFTPEATTGASGITRQTVTAYPVGDCITTTSPATFPAGGAKIESKVVYDKGKEVVHASIVTVAN